MQGQHTSNKAFVSADRVIFASAALGIILGAAAGCIADGEHLGAICDFQGLKSCFEAGRYLSAFFEQFIRSWLWIFASFVLGFGSVFQPLSVALLTFNCAGLGACMRGVYLTEEVAINLALFLPLAVSLLTLTALQTKNALHMQACYLAVALTDENRIGLKRETKDYFARFLILSGAAAICTVVQIFIARLII